ncbi:MAG TPA: DUF1080 domain-containing protein [Chitinophagaceae bacterium]|nr:DUF1080 domain-containing protein [Chitinophagaceae bacterium]
MKKTWRYCMPALLAALLFTSFSRAQTTDNTLSKAEKKAGWQLLFNGQSTSLWRPYKNAASDGWEVVDGQVHCKEKGVQHRADLVTKEKFADFELAFDWKVSTGANSGLVYRVDEEHGAAHESGSEYQLIDDIGYPGKLEDWQHSGADYDMHPPVKLAALPAGQFNHSVIKAKGKHIEHWLNGVKVAAYEIGTPEWLALKEKSKWKDIKGWGENAEGYICLQDHGGGIWFKNIKILRL